MKPSNKSPMPAKKPQLQGLKFLAFVVVLYVVLFFVNPEKTVESLQHFVKNTLSVLPIFLLVIFLTALINYYFTKEKIAKMMQTSSPVKMYLVSLFAGIISHGPVFVWFPLLKDLKDKGFKNSSLVTFIYARSIKLTLLPVMIGFFGQLFTLIFMGYIALAAIIQGIFFDFFYTEKEN